MMAKAKKKIPWRVQAQLHRVWRDRRLGGAAASYDAAAQAIFDAFTTPPTAARKAIINTCVLSLKSAGIWSKLDLLYMMAAADSQAARINWVNPSNFTALTVNSPAFVADQGFTGDGSASRLRTQYTPSVNGVNFVQDDSSGWVYSRTNAQGSSDIGGATVPRLLIQTRSVSDTFVGDLNNAVGATITVANSNSVGFFGVQRRGATDRRLFANGSQVAADARVSTAIANQEQWICGANSTNFSSKQLSVAAWGASLSGLESAFNSAIVTYLQSVGAA